MLLRYRGNGSGRHPAAELRAAVTKLATVERKLGTRATPCRELGPDR